MGKNRRASRRVPARGCRVDFSVRGRFLFSKVIFYDNLMVDLSPGGLRFDHPNPLPVGKRLGLTIHPPHTFLPVRVTGRVAWVQADKKNGNEGEYSIGVKFGRMGARDRKQVRQVLDALTGYFGLPRIPAEKKQRRKR